jgi:hypothetical protein
MKKFVFTAFVLALAINACEADFDAFSSDQSEISAFGYLEANADTQWVRVVPGRKLLERPSSYSGHGINLTLRGVNSVDFRDTLLQLQNGEPALLFYSVDSIGPLTQWDLSMTGKDYGEVTAKIDVPDLIPPSDILYDAPYYTANGYQQNFFINRHTDYFFIEGCY